MLLSRARSKGITLVELLVVLAILGLLATIAVPAYINRMEQARKVTARAECEEIAKAEELLGATYGFFLPLQLLDNVPPPTSSSSAVPEDSFDNEMLSQLYAIDLSIAVVNQVGNQDSGGYNLVLEQTGTDVNQRVVNMVDAWNGPYLKPQRVYTGTSSNASYPTDSAAIRQDHPLDPWNRPYRLFSPLGIVGASASNTTYDSDSFSNGRLTTNDDRFDRFAVVSFGPDGQLDSTGSTATKDDIYYLFGPGETMYSPTFF